MSNPKLTNFLLTCVKLFRYLSKTVKNFTHRSVRLKIQAITNQTFQKPIQFKHISKPYLYIMLIILTGRQLFPKMTNI